MISLGLLLFVSGAFTAFSARMNLLMIVLGMEFSILGSFIILIQAISQTNISLSNSFFYLVFTALEASVALTLVVILTRHSGHEML